MRAVGWAEQETALPGWAVQTVVHGTLESSDVQGLLCDGQRPPLPFRVNLEPLETSRSSAHRCSVPTQRPLACWPALPPEAVRGRLRPVPGPATLSLVLPPQHRRRCRSGRAAGWRGRTSLPGSVSLFLCLPSGIFSRREDFLPVQIHFNPCFYSCVLCWDSLQKAT